MMSQSVSMSLSNDYSHYPFSSASMIPLPWIPHPTTPQSSFKLFTPQINPYTHPPKITHQSLQSSDSGLHQSVKRKASRKGGKPSYKHIPHRDKPPHLVARRNARERRRVQAVNSAFARLRKCVPIENRNKRLSKVKTLHRAIEYINGLQAMLRQSEHSDLSSDGMQFSRRLSESLSPDDDDEDEEDVKDEKDEEEYPEFEDYLESDGDVVNKENEGQTWTGLSTGCESSYWTYMPYNQDYAGNIAS